MHLSTSAQMHSDDTVLRIRHVRHRAGSSRASTEGGSVCAPTELVDRLIPKVPGVDENRFTTAVVPPIKATKLIEH